MDKVKKTVPFALIIVLLSMLWSAALKDADYTHSYFNTVSLRFENKHLKLTSVRDIINKEIESNSEENISVTAWSVERWVTVEDKFLNRNASADALYLYGSMPDNLSLYSKSNCVVSEDVAYALWGDRESGRKLVVGSKEYTVTQVVSGMENTVLLPTGDDGPDASGMEINFPEGGSSSGIDSFLSNHSLIPSSVVRYEDVCSVMTVAVHLPGLAAFVAVVGIAIKCARRVSGFTHKAAVWVALICLCILCLNMTGTKINLHQDLIPTRWSDFEFWQQKLNAVQEGIEQYILAPHTRADLLFERLLFKAVVFSSLASIFMVWAFRALNISDLKDALLLVVCAITVPFAAFIMVGGWSFWYQALTAVYILTEYIFGTVSDCKKSPELCEGGVVCSYVVSDSDGTDAGLTTVSR